MSVLSTDFQSTPAGAPGFKKTEIGLLPENWCLGPISSVSTVIDGDRGLHYPSSDEFSDDGHCLFLNAGNVTRNGFGFSDCMFITREKDCLLNKGKLKRDDVVLTTRGTVGNLAFYGDSIPYDHIRINSGMVILRPDPEKMLPHFLFIILNSHIVQSQIAKFSFGSAQPQLTVKGISGFHVAVPPLHEQRAIAAALSDVDELIGALDKLIAKKRAIKLATMQQLLTRKTRLPGFHLAWIDTLVGSVIVKYFCGPSPSCEERNIQGDDEWGVLKTTAATKEHGWDWKKHKTLPRSYWNKIDLEVKSGDVIVTKAGPRHRVGVSAAVDYVPDRIIVSGKMIGLRPNKDLATPLMLASAIAARETQAYLDQRTTGMAESQVNFENEALLNAPVHIPDITEQRAISEVIYDMDAEIAALEQRRDKTRAIKQGMMQSLLTGRVRLVEPEGKP